VEVKIWRRVADGRDGTIIEIEREKGLLPLLLYERERDLTASTVEQEVDSELLGNKSKSSKVRVE
jgi:hypothetical protein